MNRGADLAFEPQTSAAAASAGRTRKARAVRRLAARILERTDEVVAHSR